MHTRLLSWSAVVAATSAVLSFSTPLAAQRPSGPDSQGRGGPDPSEIFDRMDRNDDGKLTNDEVPDFLWSRVSQADANNDGTVTRDELVASRSRSRQGSRSPQGSSGRGGSDAQRSQRPQGPPGRAEPRGESDRRRPSSRPEAGRPPQGPSRVGASRDGASRGGPSRGEANRDGRPSRPDSDRGPQRRDSDGGSDRGRSPQNQAGRASSSGGSPGAEAIFERIDRNNDGSLSKDEFSSAFERLHRGMSSRGPQGRGGPPWASSGQGPSSSRGRGGPPWASRGPGGFAGPPWAQSDRGRSDGGGRGGPSAGREPQRGDHSHGRSSSGRGSRDHGRMSDGRRSQHEGHEARGRGGASGDRNRRRSQGDHSRGHEGRGRPDDRDGPGRSRHSDVQPETDSAISDSESATESSNDAVAMPAATLAAVPL